MAVDKLTLKFRFKYERFLIGKITHLKGGVKSYFGGLVSVEDDRCEFNFIYSFTCIYLMFPAPFAKDTFCLPVYVFDTCQILSD